MPKLHRSARVAAFAFTSAVAFAALTASFPAQAEDAGKITIMVGGATKIIYLPAKLTEQLGYFKEEGLNVEILSQPSGVDAENELIAGAVQGVVGFYDHTIDLQSKGKEVASVVTFGQVPGEVELVSSKAAPTLKSFADVKGKTLGVTGLGSSTNFLTQYLASRAGIKSSEFTVLPVGADNTFIAAMRQGRIDAGMTTEPTVSLLLKSGEAKVLVDMRSLEGTTKALGGAYPASSLYMQRAWIDSHKPEVLKITRAFVKTLKFIKTHSGEEIAAKMPPDYYGKNHDLYVAALNASKPMFTADGKMPASGPQTVLNVLSAFDPSVKGRHIDLARTYTLDFVNQVK